MYGGTFDYYSITNLLPSFLWKKMNIGQHLAKWKAQTLIASGALCACTERWTPKFESSNWHMVGSNCCVTASCNNNSIQWSCIRDQQVSDWCIANYFRLTWLMPSVSFMCSRVFLLSAAGSHSLVFSCGLCKCFVSGPNDVSITGRIFLMTVSNDRVLHDILLHLVPEHDDFCTQTFYKAV